MGSITDYGKINGIRAYGDAIYETSTSCSLPGAGSRAAGWYGDLSYLIYADYPFLCRGDYCLAGGSGALAGAFAFNHNTGEPNVWHSWRVVLWGALC